MIECLLDMCMINHTIFCFPLEDWSTVHTHPGRKCSIWYTDGSKMGRITGAGVCWPNERLGYSWSLGNFSTIFLAEVFTILMCCRICIG